jgi:hypothetical protein
MWRPGAGWAWPPCRRRPSDGRSYQRRRLRRLTGGTGRARAGGRPGPVPGDRRPDFRNHPGQADAGAGPVSFLRDVELLSLEPRPVDPTAVGGERGGSRARVIRVAGGLAVAARRPVLEERLEGITWARFEGGLDEDDREPRDKQGAAKAITGSCLRRRRDRGSEADKRPGVKRSRLAKRLASTRGFRAAPRAARRDLAVFDALRPRPHGWERPSARGS